MRLSHIIEQVYFKPWLITASAWAAIDRLIQSKLATSPEVVAGAFRHPLLALDPVETPRDLADEPEHELLDIVGRDATLRIHGVIGRRLSWVEKVCTDAVDVMDISDALDVAVARGAREITLDFDSPGGTVTGVPELAEKIARMNKEQATITSRVEGMCCSAAYWLASGTERIEASKSADIGSIGVYQVFLDYSRMYANEGVDVQVFKAGEHKAQGYPGTSLSPEYKAILQKEVDAIYDWFTSAVSSHRTQVERQYMQGQSFMGEEALAVGLIDALV